MTDISVDKKNVRHMTIKLKILFLLTLALYLNSAFGQTTNKDTNIIYHISYIGGPPSRNQHTLEWFTEREIPSTHFIIQQFCWNKWVKRGKITCSGKPGKHEYTLKVPPHSGENNFRVIIVNDSNDRITSSKEFKTELTKHPVPKVNYADKKGTKEIKFSSETDYEILNSKGTLIKEGRGISVSYADLDDDTYTLNYDNSTAIFSHINK